MISNKAIQSTPSSQRLASGSVVIYKDGTTSNSTSGATLTVDVNSLTGFHRVTITTSSDASFYSVGSTFSVVVAGTVDSQSVRAVIGTFSVQARTSAGGRVISQNLGLIEQAEATVVAIGPLLDPTSGEPVTSLTPGDITAKLIKATTASTLTLTASGGNNDFTHIANGIWSLELTSANTNHMGQFSISLVDSNVFVPVLASGVAVRTQAYESLVLDDDCKWMSRRLATRTSHHQAACLQSMLRRSTVTLLRLRPLTPRLTTATTSWL